MSRRSRGCQPCRVRKIKCDEGRPSCRICVQRDTICHGYRDEASLVFKDESERTARKAARIIRRASTSTLSSGGAFSDISSVKSRSPKGVATAHYPPDLSTVTSTSLSLSTPFPWAKSVPNTIQPSVEDRAVSHFFEQFVMYPCNDGSSPGFLESLPCLFEEVETEGRVALRWAVRAVSYASLLNEQNRISLAVKIQKCYGKALVALGETLRDREAAVSDYTLMTIVVLDLFEAIYLGDSKQLGSHTVGMAQILRLRGPNQIYSARGWSLFRLAHHRLQKQQLAFNENSMPESDLWIGSLSDALPEVRIEKDNLEINKICAEARNLRARVGNPELAFDQTLDIVAKIHDLDRKAASWRAGPAWEYKIMNKNQLSKSGIDLATCPEFIQLHRDVWIAYEWNYHRTARIIMHQQLLECLDRLLESTSDVINNEILRDGLMSCRFISAETIINLASDILSTVPQSLGDIDHEGNVIDGANKPKAIGGYFLLWPIKIVKKLKSATAGQRNMAEVAFERIRECTGMKYALGDASQI